MSARIALRCTCGDVHGTATDISPETVTRLACMCDDCQAYAHWLGRADEILDDYGGTEVVQLTPAQLQLNGGFEHVRCVRLGPRGLMRWYAGCCKTPVANMLASPKMPFAGVVHSFIDTEAIDEPLDAVFGPVRARVQGRFAPGALPDGGHRRAPVGLIARAAWQLLRAWAGRKHRPSPVYDDAGTPLIAPEVLSEATRRALRERCGPARASG
ncbi:MAG: DUF6151 family protein [Myxococcota bacterium]